MSRGSDYQADDNSSYENPTLLNQRSFSSVRPLFANISPGLDDLNRIQDRQIARSSRSLRDNLQNVIQEIRESGPLTWLNNASTERPPVTLLNELSASAQNGAQDSFVINLEGDQSEDQGHNHGAQTYRANGVQSDGNRDEQNNHQHSYTLEQPGDILRQSPEARELLTNLVRYLPFSLILLSKCLYENRESILTVLVLLVSSVHANKVVVREAGKQQRKSFSSLAIELLYIAGCVFLISYMFNGDNLFVNLVFIGSYTRIVTVWDLIWAVGLVDLVLKLLTMAFKIMIITLPNKILAYPKRGKIFYMVEMSSQLYRALTPIQPWLYYLLDSYQGTEKVMGVLFSAAYIVSKGSDLVQRAIVFKTAFLKLLQEVTLGIAPTVEQLISAGNQCPICHDEYNKPVLLTCRHIFCEPCVTVWFDREQTCPLCRAKVVDDPSFKNGATTYFLQLY